jgi:hypothetical protein
MAVEDYWAYHEPSRPVYFAFWQPRNGYVWDQNTGDFLPKTTAGIDPFITATERPSPGGSEQSMYLISIELNALNPDPEVKDFAVIAYEQQGLSPDFDADIAVAQLNTRIQEGQLVEGSGCDNPCIGDGSVLVNENYGGPNNLCYVKDGVPVDNAEIRIYLASDYQAGRTGTQYLKAVSRTTVDGSWAQAVMLDPGQYIIQFHKQGVAGPDAFCIEVVDA